MTGAQPDVAWSVQTGIDLDAMLAAQRDWIERVRRKTKRDYQQQDKPVLKRVYESLRMKYETGFSTSSYKIADDLQLAQSVVYRKLRKSNFSSAVPSLLESVVVDLNVNPHLLIGDGTGSGKTVLLRLILMQLLKKKDVKVTIADFKGGVDFASCWKEHPNCNMIFDRSTLLAYLDSLVEELEHRKQLFASKDDCNNIYDYNRNPLYTMNHTECLDRIVFSVDEVAEVLDKTGLSKEEKDQVARIENRIATIARLGRAFGIHLILATQRPDSNIICGQIKNNVSYRICGRADNVLSMIILDNTSAADEIPSDARGRFINNNGTIFQAYWFDESNVDWDAQI